MKNEVFFILQGCKNIYDICKIKCGSLSNKTSIYIGKQNPKTLKIIKKILKKNPSQKYYYGKDFKIKRRGNYYLYSEILKHSELIKTKNTEYQLLNTPYINTRSPIFKLFLFFLTRLSRWFPRRVTFVEVDIPQKSLYKFL